MRWRDLSPLHWILAFLCLAEVAVEWRAAGRGHPTLLFDAREPAAATQEAEPVQDFGPAEGFRWRSRVLDPSAPAAPCRIWVASSSHAQDTAHPAPELFPNEMQRMLREGGHRCEVINASVAGASMQSHLDFASEEGRRWQPGYVLLYQMSNDISRMCQQFAGELPPDSVLTASSGESYSVMPQAVARTAEETTLYGLLKTNLTSMVAQGRVLRDSLSEDEHRRFESLVRRFVDRWLRLGAMPVLCTFATSHDRGNLDQMSAGTRRTIFRHNMHLSLEGWLDTVERWNQILRRVARDRDLPVIDLAAHLQGEARLFRDFVHFTEEGHDTVARILARRMDEILDREEGR